MRSISELEIFRPFREHCWWLELCCLKSLKRRNGNGKSVIRHGPGNLDRRLHRIFCLSFVTSSIFAMQTTQLSVNGFRRQGTSLWDKMSGADHSHLCCRTYEMCGAEPPSFAETWYLGYMASFRFVYVSGYTVLWRRVYTADCARGLHSADRRCFWLPAYSFCNTVNLCVS
jgi:hypothetical protein